MKIMVFRPPKLLLPLFRRLGAQKGVKRPFKKGK
jgi:hypothetical protein